MTGAFRQRSNLGLLSQDSNAAKQIQYNLDATLNNWLWIYKFTVPDVKQIS